MNKQLKSIEKLMELKEKDFNESQAQYQLAVEYFEKTGEELYNILKTKEKLSENHLQQINTKVKAFELKNQFQQLEQLKQQENDVQIKVQQARNNLQDKDNKRKEAHFEYKKLEKVRENRLKSIKKQVATEENQQLDEISVQQYMRING